jgi:hypothetical protein
MTCVHEDHDPDGVYFDLCDPVDQVTRFLLINGIISFEEVPFGKRCVEKGLRNDFSDGDYSTGE